MKSKATEAAASIVPNNAGVLIRICTALIRTFLLNLIAQIALGTPVAAQTPDKRLNILKDQAHCLNRECPSF